MIAKIRLTKDQYRVLEVLRSLPTWPTLISYPTTKMEGLRGAWEGLQDQGIVDGHPGAYYVRWGLLSAYQYSKIEKAVKNAS